MQYADLRKGLTADAVRVLLNSIYIAERHKTAPPSLPVSSFSAEDTRPPQINPTTVISVAASAMERGQYDQAVFLLKQAKANGYASRFVKIDDVLTAAENGLEKATFLREAEREYRGIASLIKNKSTRTLGCTSFADFVQAFPDYDPDNLATICGTPTSPVLPAPAAPTNGSAPTAPPAEPTNGSSDGSTYGSVLQPDEPVEAPVLPVATFLPTDEGDAPSQDTLPPDELDVPPSDPPETIVDAADKAEKPPVVLPVPNIVPMAIRRRPKRRNLHRAAMARPSPCRCWNGKTSPAA
jgi:hypothetical protein